MTQNNTTNVILYNMFLKEFHSRIAQCIMPTIQIQKLNKHKGFWTFETGGGVALGAALSKLSALQCLALGHNILGIGGRVRGFAALAATLSLPKLRRLGLQDDQLYDSSVGSLVEILPNLTQLSHCHIHLDGSIFGRITSQVLEKSLKQWVGGHVV